MKAPGAALFSKLHEALGELPFIAEDLGVITKEVDTLREQFGMPGMRILQFGFGDRASHNYLPHKFVPNSVVYTGTHDNDTTRGWWEHGATVQEKAGLQAYLDPGEDGVVWRWIRSAASSVADICLFPLQDILEISSEGTHEHSLAAGKQLGMALRAGRTPVRVRCSSRGIDRSDRS